MEKVSGFPRSWNRHRPGAHPGGADGDLVRGARSGGPAGIPGGAGGVPAGDTALRGVRPGSAPAGPGRPPPGPGCPPALPPAAAAASPPRTGPGSAARTSRRGAARSRGAPPGSGWSPCSGCPCAAAPSPSIWARICPLPRDFTKWAGTQWLSGPTPFSASCGTPGGLRRRRWTPPIWRSFGR